MGYAVATSPAALGPGRRPAMQCWEEYIAPPAPAVGTLVRIPHRPAAWMPEPRPRGDAMIVAAGPSAMPTPVGRPAADLIRVLPSSIAPESIHEAHTGIFRVHRVKENWRYYQLQRERLPATSWMAKKRPPDWTPAVRWEPCAEIRARNQTCRTHGLAPEPVTAPSRTKRMATASANETVRTASCDEKDCQRAREFRGHDTATKPFPSVKSG